MTVHSLPSPGGLADADARRTRVGRLKMLMVMLVCAAPVIASYLTYYVIRPEGRRNYGELIDPQRPVPDVAAARLDGSVVRLPQLKGQWVLLSVSAAGCDSGCERHLYLQRQLRESLGREKDRMDWVWLVTDAGAVRSELMPALAQATVWRVDAAALAQWLQPASGQSLGDHLYVIDPMGNWMMRFPAQIDPARAKRDLERLMRGSASWDQPGR